MKIVSFLRRNFCEKEKLIEKKCLNFENSETKNLTNKILDLFFEFDVTKRSSLTTKKLFFLFKMQNCRKNMEYWNLFSILEKSN